MVLCKADLYVQTNRDITIMLCKKSLNPLKLLNNHSYKESKASNQKLYNFKSFPFKIE